jgi:hypothetical protein
MTRLITALTGQAGLEAPSRELVVHLGTIWLRLGERALIGAERQAI